MNNTSNSDSKAKLIVIIVSLFVVIALTFILKQYQNKVITEITESNTKQNTPKDIKATIQDSTSKESLPEEADKSSENIESAGDMNGDTSEGVEITDKMKSYNESPDSTVTEEDNTVEEPKQEEVYVPDSTPQVDDTPAPAPESAPILEDNSNSNSGLDWGDSSNDSNVNWDSSQDWMPEGIKQVVGNTKVPYIFKT